MSKYRAMGSSVQYEFILAAVAHALTDMMGTVGAKSLEEWLADPNHWLNLSLSDCGLVEAISAVSAESDSQ